MTATGIIMFVLIIALVIVTRSEQRERANYQRLQKELQLEKQRLQSDVAKRNKTLELENKRLERAASELQNQISSFDERLSTKEKEYENELVNIANEFSRQKDLLEMEHSQVRESLDLEIKQKQDELEALKSKQQTYISAKLREQERQEKADFYRLNIAQDAHDDISYLRNMQKQINRKEIIDKVIYEGYIKQPYNDLMARLFQNKDKICGIYKITSLKDDRVYIGQSVDCRSRIKNHIKSAIETGGAANKLYAAMKEQGLENFSFELLEEIPRDQLNEREAYWIDFYQSKDYGFNTQKGNGTLK